MQLMVVVVVVVVGIQLCNFVCYFETFVIEKQVYIQTFTANLLHFLGIKKAFLPECNLEKYNETFNQNKDLFTNKLELSLRKKLVNACVEKRKVLNFEQFEEYIRDTWKVLKYVAEEEKQVGNEEVLHIDKEQRNILQIIKGRMGKQIGHILRRNLFLKDVIEGILEGRIEVTD